jgi:uncharacterized protein
LNLLETVLDTTQVKIVDVGIDSVDDGVFIGTVRLKQGPRVWTIDARPSDAIGLAVGAKAPIFVSTSVLRDAALNPDDLAHERGAPSERTPSYEESL